MFAPALKVLCAYFTVDNVRGAGYIVNSINPVQLPGLNEFYSGTGPMCNSHNYFRIQPSKEPSCLKFFSDLNTCINPSCSISSASSLFWSSGHTANIFGANNWYNWFCESLLPAIQSCISWFEGSNISVCVTNIVVVAE